MTSSAAPEAAARPLRIACLHTLAANAALFDDACPEGVTLEHHLREDLLARAIERGEADEEIIAETAAALSALEADGVLLTCTTIAPGAERAGAVRVDAALAEAAGAAAGAVKGVGEGAGARGGGVIEALITIPTTAEATRGVFEAAAGPHGATVKITMVEGALAAFQDRRLDDYARLVAAAADASEADVVALAQASMAPAAALTTRPVMTSPAAGLRAVIKIAANKR